MKLAVLFIVFGAAAAQNFRVCIPSSEKTLCNNIDREGQATCHSVESRVDCAIVLARGEADFGVFDEEETILLGHQQPNDNRVVATIRDVSRTEPYAFEAVAIVSNSHTGGLEGLKDAKYCHPGLDTPDLRWSPRVLKTFEQAVAHSDRCPSDAPPEKTVEELEVEELDKVFSAACRPGPWSYNATIDANLKSQYPKLCSLCGPNSNTTCAGYSIDMGVTVSGVNNNNRHIQALECLRSNGNGAVAYVAWLHVREYFTIRNPDAATSFAALCPDGTTRTLTAELLSATTAPCAFVRQPWSTIVASSANAASVQSNMRTWWPNGANPGSSNTWQSILFNGIVGGSNARVVFEDDLPTPANYSNSIRPIPAIDVTAPCQPARRWCTLSTSEHTKCSWIRNAAYILGIQPTIICLQRASIFDCLADIKEDRADFIASSSNYGYVARQNYNLVPVKLLQNARTSANSRVAAFVKESATASVSRFENLRGKKACFPEYGGIAYVAFVRAAQERGVISSTDCDYLRVVGELFDGACAPGALDASHSISESDYNATSLCTVCQPSLSVARNNSELICSWDDSNKYFGNEGALACLADPTTDVAFLQTHNIEAHLTDLGIQASSLRALCRNNTLAATTGVNIDDGCLLAHTVDAEVITRRDDPRTSSLSVLLETLDLFFGYVAESHAQLINLEIFSPFDKISDLLFKDSAIGFAEPTLASTNELVRNYIELFQHLMSCNSAPGIASNHIHSVVMTILMAFFTRFVVY